MVRTGDGANEGKKGKRGSIDCKKEAYVYKGESWKRAGRNKSHKVQRGNDSHDPYPNSP